MNRRGAPRTIPQVACPNPKHAGSSVKANGTRTSASGLRRDYRCRPTGDKAHNFAVLIDLPAAPAPVKATPPACPLHGTKADIVRHGRYGRKSEELHRQRYRCVPTEPAAKAKYEKGVHYFTPPLAREHIHYGDVHCDDCGELRGVHRGDEIAARNQTWNLRTVAEGLSRLSAGASYSSVSRWAWESTGRDRTRPAKLSDAEKRRRETVRVWRRTLPRRMRGQPEPVPPPGVSLTALDPDPGYARRRRVDAAGIPLPRRRKPSPSAAISRARWHVAADWTSMYSACLWLPLHERLLTQERAEHDRRAALSREERVRDARPQVLLLDDLPVMTKARPDGYGNRRVKRTYFVLAAGTVSWSEPRSPRTRAWETEGQPEPTTRLRLLRGFATNEAESWLLLFQELGYISGVYEPEVVLADAGTGLQKAAKQFFKKAILVPSLWHIQNAIVEALTKKSGPEAILLTDLGPALHPRLADHLAELSTESLHAMDAATWRAWWDDLETAMTGMGLPVDAIAERRSKYQPALEAVLPVLAANPSIPVSTGGFETVLRNTASAMIAGRAHALSNLERCASLFDLCVCRDHGVFHSLTNVAEALRKDGEKSGGWTAAPRLMADPQPPAPAAYSSLRDWDLPVQLVNMRELG